MDAADFGQWKPAPLLTVKDVAKLLRLSDRTVWKNTEPRGTIPAVYIGKSVRYCPNAIQQWMKRQMAGVASTTLSA